MAAGAEKLRANSNTVWLVVSLHGRLLRIKRRLYGLSSGCWADVTG